MRNNLFICLIKTPASTAIHRFNAQGSSKPIAVLNLSVFYLFYLPTSQTHPMPPPLVHARPYPVIFSLLYTHTHRYINIFLLSLSTPHTNPILPIKKTLTLSSYYTPISVTRSGDFLLIESDLLNSLGNILKNEA